MRVGREALTVAACEMRLIVNALYQTLQRFWRAGEVEPKVTLRHLDPEPRSPI